MRSRCLFILSVPVLAFLSGCQTGDVKAVVPISGGGQITVPMRPGGPPPGEAEGYKVVITALQPAKEDRQVFYEVALFGKQPALKRIQVEDISDEQPALLVDDQNPQFKERVWLTKSEVISADDSRMKWVLQIPMSLRVYRFTLTATDGHLITFDHVTLYPPFIKAAIRSKWGEKY